MKGYRKIGGGALYCSSMYRKMEDNYALDEYKRSYAKAALLLNEYPKEQLLMVIDDLKKQCCGRE